MNGGREGGWGRRWRNNYGSLNIQFSLDWALPYSIPIKNIKEYYKHIGRRFYIKYIYIYKGDINKKIINIR